MSTKSFKYQSKIQEVEKMGFCCPPKDAVIPSNLKAYRYVFANEDHPKNHKPVGISNPNRYLTEKGKRKCCTLSLSCFAKKDGAIGKFYELKSSIPNIGKSIGNTLCEGIIADEDGIVTEPGHHTHFELFEFQGCDLSQSFKIIEELK